VVVGSEDPDPRVSGSGIAALREAGIDVLVGVEEQAAVALDPGYFHHRRTGRPRVTLKAAATLDGQVAAADGTSKWITSEEARRDGHVLRSRSDAVMVGAGTVLSDDPRLDVRLEGSSGPQPRPVVVGGYRPLPRDAEVFRRGAVTFSPAEAALPGEVVVLPGPGGVDLWAAMEHLGNAGIVDLLVEGGPTLAVGLLNAGLVDRLVLYVAARIGGGTGRPVFDGVFATLADSFRVEMDSVDRLGPDLRIVCRVAGKG
jgi:diaminohydroxyphosphoribosylaminopyrimidine deaminase/5-amino-6-(5-phosphoribosylamino)uracil reductase